ncbi:hypothetical protein [Frankia sp. CiP3]|nr:hypothetical protein [Frankia sp. CiP3]
MTSMATHPAAETIAGERAVAGTESGAAILDEELELARRLVEQARAEGCR